jgi:hypothetical protein
MVNSFFLIDLIDVLLGSKRTRIRPCFRCIGQIGGDALPDREGRFEEADNAAEESADIAGIYGNEAVAGNIPAVIDRILHDHDLLPSGAFAAVVLLTTGAV